MSNDITKPNNHLFWLWSAYAALFGMALTGYISLRERDDALRDKMAANELRLQVQLTEIKTRLTSIDVTLHELKENQRRHEP
jgi:Tfp pilus assembly ATPase PilU